MLAFLCLDFTRNKHRQGAVNKHQSHNADCEFDK